MNCVEYIEMIPDESQKSYALSSGKRSLVLSHLLKTKEFCKIRPSAVSWAAKNVSNAKRQLEYATAIQQKLVYAASTCEDSAKELSEVLRTTDWNAIETKAKIELAVAALSGMGISAASIKKLMEEQ